MKSITFVSYLVSQNYYDYKSDYTIACMKKSTEENETEDEEYSENDEYSEDYE